MADGVWKGVYPLVLGRSRQVSINKFFDPSAPSMRKVDNGEKSKPPTDLFNHQKVCGVGRRWFRFKFVPG